MAERKSELKTTIPIDSIGLLEIDRAVYNWFDSKHQLTLEGRKVPVIFGAWERFAQIQGNKNDDKINSMRDSHGKIKLPIISIRRGDVTPDDYRYRQISIDVGPSFTFHKEIAMSKFDKDQRVPFTKKWKVGSTYATTAPVYETYTLPFPNFIKVPYTITFWSSFVSHMNLFHNIIWNDYKISDIEYNGFFFYADFDGSSDESNTEDFSTDERLLKHSFNLNVQGYLIDKENDVTIDRTVSKFAFDECMIEADDMNSLVNDTLYPNT